MKTVRTLVAAAVLGAMTAAPAAAGVLLGTGTLNNPDDLTRIQVGGNTWEYLDLSATGGLSVAAALSTYSPVGFRWANGAEVAELYSAFGITYQVVPNSFIDLGANPASSANFVAHLGVTAFQDAALGWLDDLTSATHHTYSCISIADCGPSSFVYNVADGVGFWPELDGIGVYLVRGDIARAPVPVPATLALLGIGLAGLGWSRRKPG